DLLRRTTKLTARRALTHEKSRTPRRKSEAQTAVRCSAIVRRRAHPISGICGQNAPAGPDSGPSHGARKITRESRETHEKNPRLSAVRIQSRSFTSEPCRRRPGPEGKICVNSRDSRATSLPDKRAGG